ncbi:MAG: leucine-rich repeat domain-containing protein [Chitinophagaceae bacterium]
MKKLMLIYIFFSVMMAANAQVNYDEAMKKGEDEYKKGEYKKAINYYFAAAAFMPENKGDVKEKVNKAFDAIEALRKKADGDKARAEKAEKDAVQSAAKATAEIATAQKLNNAFYFYKDRFALAFKNDSFYFIDKNGDAVEKLDRWNGAEHFLPSGFAKVKLSSEIFKLNVNFIIDTFGNSYKAAYEIKDIDTTINAVELYDEELNEVPSKIFILPKLKVLILRNVSLTGLPKEIGGLKYLTHLDVNYNMMHQLPEEIGDLENLTYLDLSVNKLTSMPKGIGKLKKLRTLNLNFNSFKIEEIEKIRDLLPNCEVIYNAVQ